VAQVQQEMDALTIRLRRDFPNFYPPNGGLTFSVLPLHEQVVGGVRRSLGILIAAVACVLLISCANVASLLLSRAVGRQKEIAVRSALGADRWRIVRQLLTESVLLAAAGEALGSKSVPRLHEIRINAGVLAFTLALSVLSAIVFGLLPALRAASADLQTELKEGHGGSSGLAPWGRRQRTRRILVVAELTLAVMLLVGAGLLIRSFGQIHRVPPGFNPSGVLTIELTMNGRKYGDAAKVLEAAKGLWARLDRLPGVTA